MEVDLSALLQRLPGREACVIGDVILDRYERGRSHRLCREAPVPAVELTATDDCPGGAGNTAVNITALGGRATLISAVGHDVDGRTLTAALEAHGVTARLTRSAERTTPFRRRIVVGDRMLLRVDGGTTAALPTAQIHWTEMELRALPETARALVVSDYGCGVVTPRTRSVLVGMRERFELVVVDTKTPAAFAALRPDAVTPDYAEAVALLGLPVLNGDADRAAQVTERGSDLLAATGARSVLVTLGAAGVVLFEPGRPAFRARPPDRSDQTVVGTGDAFAAALTLALSAGADPVAAAELATAAAAGSAVGAAKRVETAVVDPDALRRQWLGTAKVLHPDDLRRWGSDRRAEGRRVVFTNGCFDLVHEGHITLLSQAKALGDVLVVAVNDDESVRALKGEDRPVIDLAGRLRLLSALSCVDHVVAFGGPSPAPLIRAMRPDVFVKGGDYTARTLPEAPLLAELGVEVRLLGHLPGRSTTQIIDQVRSSATDSR
ncbi:PfkB family carbohydrate kinase [Actinokineospora guangxiensis]|uniref:PfkB family carbohydrate kinase n=1 Tax=Actinokineospora guangxiensis TaxID=1490288 RepID=A0ABW0EP02_9PSEU